MELYEDLKWRGLIKDEAGEDLEDKLNNEKLTFYWGTDPTADSLHIGHYSSLITAKRLSLYGHHPILLVGGATGLIGDPRPTSEREIIKKETIDKNIDSIKKQVDKVLNGKAEIVNNYDWMKDISLIDFLRDTGKYININYMLNKDIIRRRLETGITFAEFTYTLMQGYDYLHLYETRNCTLQAAGSDQWGNITTGVELINKKLNKKVYAFTMPLVLDETGKKFGKSEGNSLWLDINKTSSYELYQYLINSSDSVVESYLKIFTFLSKEEIDTLMIEHNENPHLRLAQKTLTKHFITDLHGEEEYEKALKISECLFNGNIETLSEIDIESAFKDVDTFDISLNETILDTMVNNKIVCSKREGREFLANNSITVNGNKITDENTTITTSLLLYDKYLIIRKGKKKYYIGK